MIGKPEWFERRKYTGWGVNPKTWQGYAYIAAFVGSLAVFQSMPFWDAQTRIAGTVVWGSVLLLDMLHIMMHLERDEREYKIEAIAERNAAYAMIAVIAVGVLCQLIVSSLQKNPTVDWFLIGALAAGVAAKCISNIYLERKPL